MQPAPIRLQQAIWTAIRAARPVYEHTSIIRQCSSHLQPTQPRKVRLQRQLPRWQPRQFSTAQFYSGDKKTEIDKKVEDAKARIDETIDSRAETTIPLGPPEQDTLKKKQDETIIHTLPESSSIVYNPDSPGETAARGTADSNPFKAAEEDRNSSSASAPQDVSSDSSPSTASASQNDPLPSQLAARYSHLRERFSYFMDNFQTHIFTASKRLNDLTGYSSIEQLKKDIEAQEHTVRAARQKVKDTRTAYQQAIAIRSDTQREVNDLLHRKHAWSPTDLERFTNLYRSDHVNEQSEQQAQEQLGRAEAAYEEASTKLSKSILARYHEEQVWSDKIRQMSTWGTWGLMGLNVLLFVIFQILVEPWRRKRLVKGFEQKVQEAIREQTAENEVRTIFHIERAKGEESALAAEKAAAAVGSETESAPAPLEATATSAAEVLRENAAEAPSVADMAQRTHIEAAAEAATTTEVVLEGQTQSDTSPAIDPEVPGSPSVPIVETSAENPSETSSAQTAQVLKDLPPLSTAEYKDLPFLLGSYTRRYVDLAIIHVNSLFDEKREVVLSQRNLTNRVLEGAFVGAVGVVCLFYAVGISSARGR